MQRPVCQPPFDRPTPNAGVVQLDGGDQAELTFRDPRDHQIAREPTMYEARNHVRVDNLRDISTGEMLMPGRSRPARWFRASYTGIGGHNGQECAARTP